MTGVNPQHVSVGAMQVAYIESGVGEPLVLIHGGESSRSQFRLFCPLLSPGIRSIAYDQRDTGDTVNSDESYDMSNLAADCAGFIEALGLKRAHVMGSSFGGGIALQVAINHPERVKTLIIGATLPSFSMSEGLLAEALAMSPEQRAQFMLDVLFTPKGREADPSLLEEARAVAMARSEEADVRRTAAARSHDCADRVSEISAPTLIIHGAEDPLAPPAAGEWLSKEIPNSQLEILERTRHALTLENRDITARLVSDFVLAHAGAPGDE
jgi:pimeloyl-ACP methyl ester carboxylesterase